MFVEFLSLWQIKCFEIPVSSLLSMYSFPEVEVLGFSPNGEKMTSYLRKQVAH